MDGLNHSVITGECSGCVAYREKVARLEAALREIRHEAHYWHHPYTMPEDLCGFEPCGAINRALSDTGEGWLPPEVREQARLAIGHAFHLIEHNKAMCVRCREAKQRLGAALDALKVKHELET